MEGEHATHIPLCVKECALVVEDCFTGRIYADILTMGNINKHESLEVYDIVNKHFLIRCRPLYPDEMTKIVALQLPTKNEAIRIFRGEPVSNFIVYEDMAGNRNEENNAVEIFFQIACESTLGYRGVAIVELIGHMGEFISRKFII